MLHLKILFKHNIQLVFQFVCLKKHTLKIIPRDRLIEYIYIYIFWKEVYGFKFLILEHLQS